MPWPLDCSRDCRAWSQFKIERVLLRTKNERSTGLRGVRRNDLRPFSPKIFLAIGARRLWTFSLRGNICMATFACNICVATFAWQHLRGNICVATFAWQHWQHLRGNIWRGSVATILCGNAWQRVGGKKHSGGNSFGRVLLVTSQCCTRVRRRVVVASSSRRRRVVVASSSSSPVSSPPFLTARITPPAPVVASSSPASIPHRYPHLYPHHPRSSPPAVLTTRAGRRLVVVALSRLYPYRYPHRHPHLYPPQSSPPAPVVASPVLVSRSFIFHAFHAFHVVRSSLLNPALRARFSCPGASFFHAFHVGFLGPPNTPPGNPGNRGNGGSDLPGIEASFSSGPASRGVALRCEGHLAFSHCRHLQGCSDCEGHWGAGGCSDPSPGLQPLSAPAGLQRL